MPRVRARIDDAGLARRVRVVGAGCLLRCPLDGVTTRLGHDPRDFTRGTTRVLKDEHVAGDDALDALVVELRRHLDAKGTPHAR